jgi:hypothetical protein
MNIEMKPLAEVTSRAIEVLSRELGSADAIRFINQFTNGHGDYTSERDALFDGVTMDQMISEIKRTRKSREGGQGRHEAPDSIGGHGTP